MEVTNKDNSFDYRGIGIGFFSGIAKTLISYPLDTLKANIQSSQLNMWSSTKHIYLTRGLSGFYSGIQYPLLFSTITSGSFFGTFYLIRPYFSESLWWLVAPLAGAFSGLVHAPIERLKIKEQILIK